MVKKFLIGATMTLALSSTALAQTASNQIATGSESGSAASVNNNFAGSPAHQTIATNPNVEPPGMYGGTNMCTLALSAGVSVVAVGASIGGEYPDKGCNDRNLAIVMYQMGAHNGAIALLCRQFPEAYYAMADAGTPCPTSTAPGANDAGGTQLVALKESTMPTVPKAVMAPSPVPEETTCHNVTLFVDGRPEVVCE